MSSSILLLLVLFHRLELVSDFLCLFRKSYY